MKVFIAIVAAVLACIAIPVAQGQLLNFKCPGAGMYPVEGNSDSDCKAFYLCTAENGLGVRMDCPPLVAPYFDPNTRECVRGEKCIELRTTSITASPATSATTATPRTIVPPIITRVPIFG